MSQLRRRNIGGETGPQLIVFHATVGWYIWNNKDAEHTTQITTRASAFYTDAVLLKSGSTISFYGRTTSNSVAIYYLDGQVMKMLVPGVSTGGNGTFTYTADTDIYVGVSDTLNADTVNPDATVTIDGVNIPIIFDN